MGYYLVERRETCISAEALRVGVNFDSLRGKVSDGPDVNLEVISVL